MKKNEYCSIYEPKIIRGLCLHQIGHIDTNDSFYCEPHIHLNWYEITYVDKGSCVVQTDNEQFLMKSGDMHISIPGDIHSIKSNSPPFSYSYASFHFNNENDINSFLALIPFIRKNRIIHIQTESLKRAIEELYVLDDESFILIAYRLFEISQLIKRHYLSENYTKVAYSRQKDICMRIENYIHDNIYRISSLQELENEFGYRYSYLSDVYSKQTGKTIFELFKTRRMESAKLLIKENKLSIKAISKKLNYSSVQSFSRAYKHYWGHSPIISSY